MNGFHQACIAAVKRFAVSGLRGRHLNLFPGFVSPADLRYLKEVCADMSIDAILFPDYSETLDNVHTREYQLIPTGGTPVAHLEKTGLAEATIEFGTVFNRSVGRQSNTSSINSAGQYLEEKMEVPKKPMPLPIGIEASDHFFKVLWDFSHRPIPQKHLKERGRLVDAYVDAHKYVFGKRAVLYGEEDLVIAMAAFLKEIGIKPVLVASGASSGIMQNALAGIFGADHDIMVADGSDFATIREMMPDLKPDLMIGNSKGYYIARELKIPIIRIGFPIHDRFGASRMHHIGYRGTQELFDRIVNALIEYKQESSPVGYKYI